jgi:hypothetical protein
LLTLRAAYSISTRWRNGFVTPPPQSGDDYPKPPKFAIFIVTDCAHDEPMMWWLLGSAVVVIAGLVFVIRFESSLIAKDRRDGEPVARHLGQLRHDHAHKRAA